MVGTDLRYSRCLKAWSSKVCSSYAAKIHTHHRSQLPNKTIDADFFHQEPVTIHNLRESGHEGYRILE
jgi:hypothetical protein